LMVLRLVMWVDPRACGVDYTDKLESLRLEGGSPRMRGRLLQLLAVCLFCGWIPAHAG